MDWWPGKTLEKRQVHGERGVCWGLIRREVRGITDNAELQRLWLPHVECIGECTGDSEAVSGVLWQWLGCDGNGLDCSMSRDTTQIQYSLQNH